MPAHADTVFTDSSFKLSNYNTDTFKTTGIVATSTECAACGDPNGPGNTALQLSISFPIGTSSVDLGFLNKSFSYDPLTQGAITSITASVDKDITLTSSSGGGNTFHPLIEQDGIFYIASISGPGLSGPGTTGYNLLSDAGLTAADFVSINFVTGATGTAHPNFDGDTMLFGLAQVSGSNGSALLTADYDNISFDLVTPARASEPSGLLLLGVGMAGLLLISRR